MKRQERDRGERGGGSMATRGGSDQDARVAPLDSLDNSLDEPLVVADHLGADDLVDLGADTTAEGESYNLASLSRFCTAFDYALLAFGIVSWSCLISNSVDSFCIVCCCEFF